MGCGASFDLQQLGRGDRELERRFDALMPGCTELRPAMRTTLDIEGDVLAAAKDLAQRQGVSAGKVVSRLLRSALTGEAPAQRSGAAVVAGFRPFAANNQRLVGNEQIDQLGDLEGI
jgi:hypothetical protein